MSRLLDDEQYLLHQSLPRSLAARRDPSVKNCLRYGGIACVTFTVLVVGIFICVIAYDISNVNDRRVVPVFPVRVKTQRHGPIPIFCHVNVARMYDVQNPYLPSNVPGNYCSHLVLPLRGFYQPNNNSFDLPSNFIMAHDRMITLRGNVNKSFPHLKHLISVGDEAHGGRLHFSDTSSTNATAYMTFLVDLMKWVLDNAFSGIVLHRVFPVDPHYRRHMVLFLSHFKQVMHRHGLLFVVTTPYDAGFFQPSTRPGKLSKFLDYVGVVTHGFVNAANTSDRILMSLRHHTRKGKSVEDALEGVVTSGLPRNRVLVIISLTGYMCTLAYPLEKNHVPNWSDAKETRVVSYQDVCQKTATGNWTVDYDAESEKPYAFSKDVWIGYEDEISVRKLASLVEKMYLGGVLIWDVANDDYAGLCGPVNPLVKAIFTELEGAPLEDGAGTIISNFNQSSLESATETTTNKKTQKKQN